MFDLARIIVALSTAAIILPSLPRLCAGEGISNVGAIRIVEPAGGPA